MARFNFDVAEYEEESKGGNFELLPIGEYQFMCVECVEKDTKAGTGTYLAATMEIIDGEYTSRKVWFNFNINNPSAKAESIGRGQVRAWAKACGKPDVEDTDDLIEVPFSAVLGIQKGKDGYDDSNVIKKFIDITETGTAVEAAKPAATAPARVPPARAAAKTPATTEAKPAARPAPKPAGGTKNPWS